MLWTAFFVSPIRPHDPDVFHLFSGRLRRQLAAGPLVLLLSGAVLGNGGRVWAQDHAAQPESKFATQLPAQGPSPSPVVKIAPCRTTTSLTSSNNPSISGQNVLFTATVASCNGVRPPGTVNFYVGSTLFVTRGLTDGVAAFGTAGLPVGTIPFTAVYSGYSYYESSASPVLEQIVRP